jgi:hypothetical protein
MEGAQTSKDQQYWSIVTGLGDRSIGIDRIPLSLSSGTKIDFIHIIDGDAARVKLI